MTVRTAFIVSKHPLRTRQDGETVITRVLIDAARQNCSVRVYALSGESGIPTGDLDLVEIPKPPVRLARLGLTSAGRRRSLIHTRFAPTALRRALEHVRADVFLARRVYMAQAAVDAGRAPPTDRLVVLVDVLESTLLRLRQSAFGPVLRLEAKRTRRDELRCVRAASALAYMSEAESGELRGLVRNRSQRLDLVLPPAARPASLDDPVAMFVGDRRWPPNATALAKLLSLWPCIHSAVPRATLVVVGHPGERDEGLAAPGVCWPGFVEDLETLWQSTGVLLAPISSGGGVRVKVLEAARHGVPVVGTPAAIGSADRYLPLASQATDDEFVAEAVALLGSSAERRRRGNNLYEVNRGLDAAGFLENQLATLLTPSCPG